MIAAWRSTSHPGAAAAPLAGLDERFTLHRLDVPRSLDRCLATSNTRRKCGQSPLLRLEPGRFSPVVWLGRKKGG